MNLDACLMVDERSLAKGVRCMRALSSIHQPLRPAPVSGQSKRFVLRALDQNGVMPLKDLLLLKHGGLSGM